MIAIKIQCGCGQKYAFDVEPVEGRLPASVACPICGADGTAAGNAAIAQSIPAQVPTAAAPGRALRVAVPLAEAPAIAPPAPVRAAPRRTGGTLLPGQMDRAQAEVEARAKISWGDPPDAVIKFLMLQGFSHPEASELVEDMFRERMATVRGNGIRNIVVGSLLMCVPVAFWFVCAGVGFIPMKLFALTIMIGAYGAWKVLRGCIMLFAPKMESGDVGEQ